MRVKALALAALMLLSACVTGRPMEGGPDADHYPSAVSHNSSNAEDPEAEARGRGEAAFTQLPTDFAPVQVSDAEFLMAMAMLWRDLPLGQVTSSPRLHVGRRLASASEPLNSMAWQSNLARSYGNFCQQRGIPGDCLTLLEDGPRFQGEDKRGLALALAVGPALDGVSSEVRAMLNPTRTQAGSISRHHQPAADFA